VLIAVAVGFALGWARGGRLHGVLAVPVRWPLLALGGLGTQAAAAATGRNGLGLGLLVGSFLMLLLFAAVNLRRPGFALVLAGVAMNLIVVAANGGMPIDGRALDAAGLGSVRAELAGEPSAKHHLAGPDDRLLFLGDVIPVPVPPGEVMSVGDAVVDAGVAWFLATAMRRGRRREAPDDSAAPERVEERG
jgi:hypothetical protein